MAAAVSRDQKSELMKYGRCDQKASRLKTSLLSPTVFSIFREDIKGPR